MKKIDNEEMRQIKYHEGFMDAMNSVANIIQILGDECLKAYKAKQYEQIMANMGAGFKTIGQLYEKNNEHLKNYLDKLAKKYEINYNKTKETLVVFEDNQELTKEKL